MDSENEKDWITKAGLRAVCLMVRGSHRCGYVGLPPGHPLYGVEYDDDNELLGRQRQKLDCEPAGKRGVVTLFCWDGKKVSPEIFFDVHGSLTYSSSGEDYPAEGPEWWLGFDCAHCGDSTAFSGGESRSLEYVVAECERLAEQIVAACAPADESFKSN